MNRRIMIIPELEKLIEKQTDVRCSVSVESGYIKVKALNLSDYYLAKSVISRISLLPVVRYGAETKPEVQSEPPKRHIKRRAVRI